MKVWLVIECLDYYARPVVGVFHAEHKAKAKLLEIADEAGYSSTPEMAAEIEEWEVE